MATGPAAKDPDDTVHAGNLSDSTRRGNASRMAGDQAHPDAGPRRRWVPRGLLAAAVALILLLGAAYFHIRVYPEYWVPRTPTSLLFEFADTPTSPATSELMRRMDAGRLDADQIQSLLELYIDDIDVDFRSPYPKGIEQKAYVTLWCPLPKKKWQATVEQIRMVVDGEQEDTVEPSASVWNTKFNQFDSPVDIPTLEEGTHTLTFNGVANIRPIVDGKAGDVACSHSFTIEKPLEIKGAFADYAAAIGSDENIEWIEQSLAAVVSYRERDEVFQLHIFEGRLPFPIAATVWARLGNDDDHPDGSSANDGYRQIGRFTSRCWKGQMFMSTHAYPLEEMLGDRRRGRLAVRLAPDPQTAIVEQLEEYFDGTIEWRRLKINPRYTDRIAPQYAKPPWRVVRPNTNDARDRPTGA